MKICKKKITAIIAIIVFLQISLFAGIVYADTYKYDALNRLIEVDCSSGEVISYTYDAAGNIISVKHNVPDLESISVNNSQVIMKVNDTSAIKVTAISKDGSQKDVTQYSGFTSGDANIADVSTDGVITAKNTGSCTVNVSYMDKTAAVSVKVDSSIQYIFDMIANFFKNIFNWISRLFNP